MEQCTPSNPEQKPKMDISFTSIFSVLEENLKNSLMQMIEILESPLTQEQEFRHISTSPYLRSKDDKPAENESDSRYLKLELERDRNSRLANEFRALLGLRPNLKYYSDIRIAINRRGIDDAQRKLLLKNNLNIFKSGLEDHYNNLSYTWNFVSILEEIDEYEELIIFLEQFLNDLLSGKEFEGESACGGTETQLRNYYISNSFRKLIDLYLQSSQEQKALEANISLLFFENTQSTEVNKIASSVMNFMSGMNIVLPINEITILSKMRKYDDAIYKTQNLLNILKIELARDASTEEIETIKSESKWYHDQYLKKIKNQSKLSQSFNRNFDKIVDISIFKCYLAILKLKNEENNRSTKYPLRKNSLRSPILLRSKMRSTLCVTKQAFDDALSIAKLSEKVFQDKNKTKGLSPELQFQYVNLAWCALNLKNPKLAQEIYNKIYPKNIINDDFRQAKSNLNQPESEGIDILKPSVSIAQYFEEHISMTIMFGKACVKFEMGLIDEGLEITKAVINYLNDHKRQITKGSRKISTANFNLHKNFNILNEMYESLYLANKLTKFNPDNIDYLNLDINLKKLKEFIMENYLNLITTKLKITNLENEY